MELVFFLLIVGVVGILAVLYFMNEREDKRVTLKGQWGGGFSGGGGDDGSFMAMAKLAEGMHVNQSPPARVKQAAPATVRKQTAKPAVKRTAVAKVPVNGKKKDPAAVVRRRNRP